MMFGRVDAIAVPIGEADEDGAIRITVYLETGRSIRTVREIEVMPLRPIVSVADLAWHADQYAQETIGADLALEGWEVIGGGEIPEVTEGEVARSAAYGVRKL